MDNLLTSKRSIPFIAANLVPRPRLFQILDQGLQKGRRLTLVSAPAGYGKTTLLAEWIRYRKLPAAWISLDGGDNDPARCVAYLADALQQLNPAEVKPERSPVLPGIFMESVLVPLINDLVSVPGPAVLVLDDYHHIHSQVVHDCMAFLIENLPQQAHVYLATRADPPLPAALLRARGQLIELRMSDLSFTPEEAEYYLNQVLGPTLSSEDITTLESCTEGWASGLMMAGLALQAQATIQERKSYSESIRSITGGSRYILDYFVEEVLQRQPGPVQNFLLQTAILERLCAPLCDAVIDAGEPVLATDGASYPATPTRLDSSRQILEYIERYNLFILPLDDIREWYRYHHLFADLLSQRLYTLQPGKPPILHRRASAWFEQHQMFDEAIRHALAAGESGTAADLMEHAAESTLRRGELSTFMHWVEQLPASELEKRPGLLAYSLLALIWNGVPVGTIEARLAFLEQDWPHSVMEAPIRAFIAINRGQIPQARQYCRQALEFLPEGEQLLRGLTNLMEALCCLFGGDEKAGVQLLEKAAAANRKTGNLLVAVLVLYQLVEQRLKEGKLRQAEDLCQQVLELAGDGQGHYLPIAGRAVIGLGKIAWERNDLLVAESQVLDGIALTEGWSRISAFDGFIALARLRQSQGNLDGAGQALDRLRELAIQFDVTEVDDLVVELLEARLNIVRGDLAAAHRWANRRGLLEERSGLDVSWEDDLVTPRLRKYEDLILARLWLAKKDYAMALRTLDPLRNSLESINRPVLLIETELLRALAFRELNEADLARQALEHALSLAEPEGYVRIFVDEGDTMAALLEVARPGLVQGSLAPFAVQLLAAFKPPPALARPRQVVPSATLYEPLSKRELEILRMLQSSLSIQEIAGELYLSVHTVRSHLKSIYSKLDVHTRYEAIARGKNLGLI